MSWAMTLAQSVSVHTTTHQDRNPTFTSRNMPVSISLPRPERMWLQSNRQGEDLVRYVRIQDKYAPEELEAARALCRKESVIGRD
jgi:hypothetical protein